MKLSIDLGGVSLVVDPQLNRAIIIGTKVVTCTISELIAAVERVQVQARLGPQLGPVLPPRPPKRVPNQCVQICKSTWYGGDHQCSFRGKVEREGKRYCGRHDPERKGKKHGEA